MSTPIQSLVDWLNTATEKLSLPAKERIKLEIKSHFEDAVETHRAEGLTEGQAQARALTDLGDAIAAAKRFRRSHLTEWEANHLEASWSSSRRCGRSFWRLGLLYGFSLLSFVLEYYRLKKHHVPLLLPGVSAIFFLTVLTISLWIACRHDSRSRPRLLLTLELLGWLNLFTFLGCYVAWVDGGFPVSILLGSSIHLARRIRLWLKIQKIGDVCQEMPPPGAAAS
jgi:hypothetical protein